jgi:uncharacterized membrane protein YjfL (UPF0719 family)
MERYLMVIFYSFLVLAFLFLAKKIADALTKYDDDAAVEQNGNMAVALRRLGLYVGMAIAMAGVMTGGSTKMELVLFIQDGAIATVIFFMARYINDYAIISGVRNNDLIKAGNVPTGLVEAGSFIATGILLNGAFTGEVGGLLPAIVFFILAEIVLVAAIKIHQKIYKFNVTDCILKNNMSAGISVAGLLISYSLILRPSIAGNFMGWWDSIGFFCLSALTGMIALIGFEKLADMIFLPKTRIEDDICSNNTAALVVVQGITIALSLVIGRLLS